MSLKDHFNEQSNALAPMAEKLQQILDVLPEKLTALPTGKDIIQFLMPLEENTGSLNPLMFAFRQSLKDLDPAVDLRFQAMGSLAGSFVGVFILTGQKNLLSVAEEQGKTYADAKEFSHDMPALVGDMTTHIMMNDEVSDTTYISIQGRVKGMDLNTLEQIQMEYFDGTPSPSLNVQSRTWFVDMPGWRQPTPEADINNTPPKNQLKP